MNNNNNEITTLANGCFWCSEAVFKRLKGVKSVLPGYSGGTVKNPSYDQVCTGFGWGPVENDYRWGFNF